MTNLEDMKKEIARKLRQAREEAQLSQEEVGELLGLKKGGYGAFERAKNLISLEYLVKLTHIFGKPLSYFLPYPNPSDLSRVERLAADPRFAEVAEVWDEVLDDSQRSVIHQTVVTLANIIRSRGA